MEKLRILAVEDPAVKSYRNKEIWSNIPYEVLFDVIPWEGYYNKMMSVFEGKEYYDIVMVAGHLWKRDFVENGYICPIELEQEDILPVIAEEIMFDGQPYLSPSFCDGHMIVYRKSIIQNVLGRRLSQIITPLEYIEVAKALHHAGYRIAMKAHESEIFTDALPFLRMYGGEVYDKITGKVTCNSTNVTTGLEAYCSLKNYAFEDTSTYGNEEIANKICNNETPLAITWSGQLGVVNNVTCKNCEDLGYATLTTAWNVTWSFAINSLCKKKPQANQLLKYLRSPKVDYIAGLESGAPVRKESYLKGKKQSPWYQCQLEMFSHAKLLPDLRKAGDKNAILYREISDAFEGKKTPREAMLTAYQAISNLEV